MSKKKKREMTEDVALEIALRDHPEWRRAWDRDALADEITGEDGQPMSPRLHLHMHAVVERSSPPMNRKACSPSPASLNSSGCRGTTCGTRSAP